MHYLEHKSKYVNLEVGNTTQQLLPARRPCWSIVFIKSFLFWVMLVTYNIGKYICIHIYKASYIRSFLAIFNCNAFSALHAKYFEIWKKKIVKLMNRFLHSTIHQLMRHFWVFVVNTFSLLWSIFCSRKLCFLWSPCLLLIAESISLDTSGKTTVLFFFKITSPSWIILSISLDKLNSLD